MKYDKIRRGGINYHGLTGEQAAEAAGRIVLENGLTESEQVDAAVHLVKAFDAGEPVFSEAVLQNIESRSLPDPGLSYVYRPRKVLVPEQMDHAGYVTSLLPPADIDSFDNLGRELLGCTPHDHARQLASMRDSHKDTHAQLVTGNATPALEQIRGHNELVPEDRDKLAETIGRHIKLFAIQTVRDRADALALFAKQPSGSAFAGFTTWKTTGHIVLATGAAPAKLLHRMITAEAKGSFEGLSDRQTIDKLVALGIFRATHAEAVGALGVLARKGFGRSGRHQQSALFKRLLAAIGGATAPLAGLTQQDMKDAGFSRMSITEYRYGLSPSEITTYLALELRQVFRHIDACVEAVLTGMPLPERHDSRIPSKRLAHTALILRADAEGDRHAIDLNDDRQGRNALDLSRNSGARVVKSLNSRLKDQALAARLREAFFIDARTWFSG